MDYKITYSKLYSMLNLFFMQRGISDLADKDSIMLFINMAIQDIYNMDSFTFLYHTERLNKVKEDDDYNYFESSYPIRKTNTCRSDQGGDMTPSLNSVTLSDTEYHFIHGENVIRTNKNIESIVINYIKAYQPVEYSDVIGNNVTNPEGTNINNTGAQTLVPLPFSFIPALIKGVYDWASPINLMAGETSEYDFYGHFKTRIKELSDSDALTDNISITM